MAFITEDVPDLGPAELADEHRHLVAWVNASRVGFVEYLNRRMIDPELPAAFYYVEGLGMGDGQRFALVRGDAIYLVSVYWGTRKVADEHAAVRVLEVSLPESAPMSRDLIAALLADALGDYYQAHPYMLRMAFSTSTARVVLDWSGVRWVVRPRQHSLLYWRTRWAKVWRDFRARLWPRIWRAITSPLAAALSLAASAWTGSGWLIVLSGAWLSLRLLRYEPDWRLSAWMIGRLKYRHPLGHLHVLRRTMEPQPLAALKVRVEPVEGEPMMRLIRVVNRSWVPVRYVSIGSYSLTGLLAPGLIELLRRQGHQRAIDTAELERHFPRMVKKWLWPGQSFANRHHLLADFLPPSQPRQVEAVVHISRFVSGEPRSGPATFLLDVEDRPP